MLQNDVCLVIPYGRVEHETISCKFALRHFGGRPAGPFAPGIGRLQRLLVPIGLTLEEKRLMKRLMITSVALLAWFSGEAMAACVPPYMSETQIKATLPGNTVCSPANCTGAACTWQEQHRGGPQNGELWDFKKGDNPMDPTEKVGHWTITPSAGLGTPSQVIISYLGGSGYSYRVKNEGSGLYRFCPSAGPGFPFSVKSGITGGCP